MKLLAYHCTDIDNKDSILTNGFKSFPGWFGDGIYFFQDYTQLTNGFNEARDWAINIKGFSIWIVFEVVIESDTFIDLVDNIQHRNAFNVIKDRLYKKNKNLGNQSKGYSDKAVFLVLIDNFKPDFIRALVDARRLFGYNNYVVRRPQIQICVLNKNVIRSILEKEAGTT